MKKILTLILFLIISISIYSQCSNCGSSIGTYSNPTINYTTVTTSASAGDVLIFEVEDGVEYSWTTCSDSDWDTQLTLYDENGCGNTDLIYNDDDCGLQSTVTWLSTYDGQVYLLLSHYNCNSNGINMTIEWKYTEFIEGDCKVSPTICDNTNITANPTGEGNYSELNNNNHGTLLDNEHYSNWIFFHTNIDCEICFTISNNTNTDYDFAIWDGIQCSPTTQPIRCSWAWNYGSYDTGLKSTDNCDWEEDNQDICGDPVDGFVKCIDANGGDEFTMIIDNYDGDNNPFTLTWDLCESDALDCDPLPVELLITYYDCTTNEFFWETLSENNNDYFTLNIGTTYNSNGLIIEETFRVSGSGTKNSLTRYSKVLNIIDKYLELYQTDFDGETKLLTTTYQSCEVNNNHIKLYPNPSDGNVYIDGDFHTIQIYDMLGKEIVVKIIDNQIIDLATGFYVVVVNNHYKVKLIIK